MTTVPASAFGDRTDLLNEIAKAVGGADLLLYGTSSREGASGNVRLGVARRFSMELRQIGRVKHLALYLSTYGGETRAAWPIVNLLRGHCEKLTVLVGGACLSAGTLMALGADEIVMGQHSTLSPVDPSFYVPVKTGQGTREVSVEDVASLLRWSKERVGLRKGEHLSQLALRLADDVGPLLLGRVNRAHGQIRSLASRMLRLHWKPKDPRIDSVVEMLCEGLYSHDHLLVREEAKELGLDVIVPSNALEDLLWGLEESLNADFQADEPFSARLTLSAQPEVAVTLPIAFLDSVPRGHVWLQEGRIRSGVGAVTTLPTGIPMPTGPASEPVYEIERRVWSVYRGGP